MAEETRHERFKRVAAKRTNDILEKIRILETAQTRVLMNIQKAR